MILLKVSLIRVDIMHFKEYKCNFYYLKKEKKKENDLKMVNNQKRKNIDKLWKNFRFQMYTPSVPLYLSHPDKHAY